MSIENATIVGNLVADPELRFTADGKAVAQIRIASSRSVFNPQTQQREDKDNLFLTVTCWRSLGENAAASLRKGQRVIATGRLTERTWEAQDGSKRSRIEMTADAVGPDLRFASSQELPSAADNPGGNYGPGPSVSAQQNDPWGGGGGGAPAGNPGHAWGNQ